MRVDSMTLDGFRNYETQHVEFDPGVNVITGDNAQGKTNLLESVYFLTCGRSFRARYDRELIGFGHEKAYLCAGIESGGRQQKLEAKLAHGVRKQFFANGARLKTASELSGRLTAVLFLPEDLYMVREGAASRRRLMDNCLSQLRPAYAAALAEYGRCYEQKTRILRDRLEKPSLLDALEEYNYRLCELSAVLIGYRARFLKTLAPRAAEIHREFSGGEDITLTYRTVKTVEDPLAQPSEILPQLLEHQAAHKRAELESGLCLAGAHKDDLEIGINGNPAKEYASQGQARTAALSIKLAERELHREDRNEPPVLLLDDVLSELDARRQNFILNRIGGGQIFITCCDGGRTAELTGGRIYTVKGGSII